MFSFFGNLFKNLNYYVNKDINETIYKNEAFKQNKWSFFEGQIVQWSQRYLFYVSMLFFFFVLLSSNLLVWKPELTALALPFIKDKNALLGWQQIFLGGQLTIVAVIYPLVVGLIGVLLQNTAGSQTILPIYQKYSGFMFSGLSGLALSLFILLGYFSKPWLSDSNYLAVCISSAVWLSLNILLTSWFFAKTFSILDATKRDNLIIRYSINELCIKDIKSRLKVIFVEHSCHKGFLSFQNKSILKIENHNYTDEGYEVLTVNVNKHKSLSNIRFWLLKLAIRLQVMILFLFRKKGLTLIFQPYRLSKALNEFHLCKTNFKLNYLVKFLIKGSVSYKAVDNLSDESFKAMSDGLLGSAIDSINNDNTHGFEVAVNNLIAWHIEISSSLAFINDHGKKDNWILLPNSGLFGRSYLNELNTEYYKLSRLASEKIMITSSYFQKMLTLHKRINSFGYGVSARETAVLIEGNYLQWHILVEWYSVHLNQSDIRLANKYEELLYIFVGAWEDWLNSIEYKYKREGDMEEAYPSFISHLGFSAQAVISALRFENFEATSWAIDILNNWLNNFSKKDHYHQEYQWKIEFLTTAQLTVTNKDNRFWKSILNEHKYEHVPAFELAFKNLTTDLRLITACYILSKPKSDHEGKIKNHVLTLLSGQCKDGGDSAVSTQFTNPGEVLGAYIRQGEYISSDGNRPYKDYLSSVIEKFERMDTQKMVSGRSYSGWGGIDSPLSMKRAYIEISLSMSSSVWFLSERWYKFILSEMFAQTSRYNLVQELKEWIKIAENIESSILCAEGQLRVFKTNFKTSIEKIIERIESVNNNLLENAEIDENKLNQLALFASSPFLKIQSPQYPFSLFDKVSNKDFVSNATAHKLTINGFGKDRVAEGIDSTYVINEENWLADGVKNQVDKSIYQSVINKVPSEEVVCESVEVTFAQIRRLALDFEKPVLFISHRNFENTIRKYTYDANNSSLFGIELRDGFSGGYLCHIDNCPVYRLPLREGKQCLITSRNLFKKLLFSPVDELQQRYVNASFAVSDNNIEGKLSLTFFMEIQLSNDQCIQLNLTFDNEAIQYN
ncbi:hypothetical protein [Psychromonas sp. SR45-3]|uniref:hypothetical protein n=1 Tax=Psychromonas sp. SR45-3 TaxID=2760930 RepID=UPI0015FB0C27|nr:hypothetical protein [Psychromonas sp. SR45-3]MBB1272511.1 hypothetical protein [Psychromonas sp. SR45-3]